MTRFTFIALSVAAMILSFGCGSKENPLSPAPLNPSTSQFAGNSGEKAIWGIWQVTFDTTTWEISTVPLRGAQFTVDVVTFLQKPMGNPANLTLAITDLTNWMTEGLLGVDVGLRHPFPGLDQYTGFDVYGVFVTPGTSPGLYDTDVTYTNGVDEAKLLNADGYTRWMNPVEFPADGTILRFVPGKLGTADIGLFTSTINGYKYFADGLDAVQDVDNYFSDPLNTDSRGFFRPGSYNVRNYELQFPMSGGSPQLVFQYAVIASWVEPDKTLSGNPETLDVPGDFPSSANAAEAIFLNVTDNSTLFYEDGTGGGSVLLDLEVYDWGALKPGGKVADEVYQIVIEGSPSVIPGGFNTFDQSALISVAQPGGSAISSVFQVEIADCTPSSNDPVPLVITIESSDPSAFDPGTGNPANSDRLASYYFHTVTPETAPPASITVTSPNGGEIWTAGENRDITWTTVDYTGDIKLEYSKDGFVSDVHLIAASAPDTGSWDWLVPNDPSTTARVRATLVDLPSSYDISDADFTIVFTPDLTLDAVRVTYGGTFGNNGDGMNYMSLDWPDITGAAEYAVYRSDLWADPYTWTEIATTTPSITEYDNLRTGPNAFDWDMDYIYEVRARSVVGNPSSEFLTTQQALVIMETNNFTAGDSAPWEFFKGANGFNGQWGGAWSCDDPGGGGVAMYFWWADMIPNGWEIVMCPKAIPDLAGQSKAYCDFMFSNGPYYNIPVQTGWAPGVMTETPVTGVETCLDFDPAPDSEYMAGTQYKSEFEQATFEYRFGELNGAFTTDIYPWMGTRYAIPKLLEDDADYAGIGMAAYNSQIQNTWAYIGLDSAAIVVY